MAKCQVVLPEEFMLKLSRLGKQTDAVSEKMLKAGGEIMVNKVRDNLKASIGKGENSRSTGELVSSLGLSSVKQDRGGNSNIKVGFAEPRSDGTSNAKIANILEYGRSGQTARPFLAPAKRAAKTACQAAMVQTFEEEIKKL